MCKISDQNYVIGLNMKHPALGQKLTQMTITQEENHYWFYLLLADSS